MRCVYGAEGYGWYWMLVEMMRDQADYRLRIDGKHSAKIYADELGSTKERITQFIKDCVSPEEEDGFALFDTDGTHFWSESLLRRMQQREEIREKRAEAGRKGGSSKSQANAKQMLKPQEANAKQERKGK